MEAKYVTYFLGCAAGKSQKTGHDFYKITLAVEITKDEKTSNAMLDFFVDASTYYKVKDCKKFQEIDAVFAPNQKGFAQILSVEPL